MDGHKKFPSMYLVFLTVMAPASLFWAPPAWPAHVWSVVIIGALMMLVADLSPVQLGQGAITLGSAGYFSVFLIAGFFPAIVAGTVGQMLAWTRSFRGLRSYATWGLFTLSMVAAGLVYGLFANKVLAVALFSSTFLVVNNALVLPYYWARDPGRNTWRLFVLSLGFDVVGWVVSIPLILMFYLLHRAYGTGGDLLALFPFVLIALLMGLGHGLYRNSQTMKMATQASAAIAGASNAHAVYGHVEDAVEKVFDGSILIIYRKIPGRDAVRREHTVYPFAGPVPFRDEVEASDGITGWAIEARSSELIADSLKMAGRYVNPRWAQTMRSGMIVSMLSDKELTGLMVVAYPEPNKYRAEDLRMAQILATQAAVSLRKIDLLAETRSLSSMDPLLQGVFNFRHFRTLLESEISGRSDTENFSVVFVDVDRFKHYNDTYGHPVGDMILQKLADRLAEEIGCTGVLARYGGDEFIALLPGADRAASAAMASRLQWSVAVLQVPGVPETFGISVGTAVYPYDGVRFENLLATADQAMYSNKEKRHERPSVPLAGVERFPQAEALMHGLSTDLSP